MPNIDIKTLEGYASNKVLKPVGGVLTWATDNGSSPSNNVKIVQGGAGVDVGVLVNAADLELGAAAGEIMVFGGGNITTPIVVGSNHTLKLRDGTYICSVTSATDVPISLKDNSSLEGASWNTIIVEPVYPKSYRTVQAFNVKNPTTIRTGGTAVNTDQSNNITVKNIQFKGVRANRHDGNVAATIYLGNIHQGRVENCWFNQTSAYGAQFGDSGLAGKYAKDGWYINNLHTNLMSSNVVVTSIEGMVIQGNIFKDCGKPPYKITDAANTNPIILTFSEPHHLVTGTEAVVKDVGGNLAANGTWSVTYVNTTQVSIPIAGNNPFTGSAGTLTARTAQGAAVEVKANGDAHKDGERIIGVNIKNNIFDFRSVNTLFSAILYQIVAVGIPNEGAVIEGNTLLGNEVGDGKSLGGILLPYPDTKGVIISNNYINKFIQRGLQLRGVRIKANNNQIILCGGDGGNAALSATDLEYSTIENNHILNRYDTNRLGNGSAPIIVERASANVFEKGVNKFNTWANNVYQRHEQKDGTGNPEAGAWIPAATTAWSATDSTYRDNTVTGFQYAGITEGANSNRNIYDGNITQLRNPTVDPFTQGLVVVGAASKIISHKYTDGSIFFGSTRTAL